MARVCLLCAALLCAVLAASASKGDAQNKYRNCYFPCLRGCEDEHIERFSRMLGWQCTDHCRYFCMHDITQQRIAAGEPVLQYNGRWPFHRFLGAENPASVVFSLANAVPHVHALFTSKKRPHYFMSPWLSIYPLVGINAWLCSAVFHTRELTFTTNLDYISALLLLSYACFLALRRLVGPVGDSSKPWLAWAVNGAFVLALVAVAVQVWRMLQGQVTYDQHMNVCIALGVVHTACWLIWYLRHRSRRYAVMGILLQCYFAGAAMLELFDFPPFLLLFDAHAIWHLLTVPLGFYWYKFWSDDANYEAVLAAKGQEDAISDSDTKQQPLQSKKMD